MIDLFGEQDASDPKRMYLLQLQTHKKDQLYHGLICVGTNKSRFNEQSSVS